MRAMKEPQAETTTHTFNKPKTIMRRCWWTGKTFILTVEEDGYMEWLAPGNLKPLEVCLPMLSREERELLISGLCEAGYEAVVGHGFDEDEQDESGD